MARVRCYIGLGSNLAEPEHQLKQALAALAGLPQSRLIATAPLYRSAPMGPQEQPDYLNTVAALDTGLEPLQLLDALQAIEQRQGRVRDGERWGARTLDLDLLLYGDRVIDTPRLQVPHPGLGQRNFVLYPLYDLAPQLRLPDGRSVEQLRRACSDEGIVPLH